MDFFLLIIIDFWPCIIKVFLENIKQRVFYTFTNFVLDEFNQKCFWNKIPYFNLQ